MSISRSYRKIRDSIGQLLTPRCRCFGTLRSLLLAVCGHARSADAINLQCTDQSLRIVGVNARRGHRVHRRQLVVQGLPAKARSLFLQRCTHLGIGRRHIGQAFL